MMKCKWCLIEYDLKDKPKGWAASHTRWCDHNPKKQEYIDKLKSSNRTQLMCNAKKISGFTNQYSKANKLGYKVKNPRKGKSNVACVGIKHTLQSRINMSIGSLKSKHRRLRRGIINYNGVLLDSSWELELAKRLDALSINWIRPDPLKWKDKNGVEHNYFPDFYLPKYNLYLDPKNPKAYLVQKEKIEILMNTYNNIIILRTIDECKSFNIN